MSASILGPNGRKYVELGGDRAWLQRVHGDIVASFQWIDLEDGTEDGPQPCLCLFPASRHVETTAYVIPQRNAHAYANKRGEPTPALMGAAFKAAVHLGFHPDRMTVHRIVDVIVEAIADLIRMPSSHPGALEVARRRMGIEARASVNGRTVNETIL